MHVHAAWSCSLLFAVGCGAAPPPAQEPEAALSYPEWGSDPGGEVPAPDPAAAGPVSLGEVLAYAERHAPALRVYEARIDVGDALVEGAEVSIQNNPDLALAAGARTVDGAGADVELEVGLSQTLEIAGERGLRVRAAARARDRIYAELGQSLWELHVAVHTAFHEALVADARREAAVQLLEFADLVVSLTERRVQAGDVSPLAARVAEAEAAQARQAVVAAEQGYLAARLRLAELSGWPVEHPPEPEGILGPVGRAPPLAQLVQLATEHHPVLAAGRIAIEAAEARARAADRDAWPEVTIGVTYAREGAPNGDPEHVVLGTLGVPIPLWQRNQGDRAVARADLGVARAELEARQGALAAQLARAASAVDAAAERVDIYGVEILPRFAENLGLLRRAYELGEIDVLQVSVARERFLQIQRDALDAFEAYYRAVGELEEAVGGEVRVVPSSDGGSR